MAIEYRGPSVPGGEVSPGSGTTGFTSRGIPFANASGQLVTNSSGPSWDSTANTLTLSATTAAVNFGSSASIRMINAGRLQVHPANLNSSIEFFAGNSGQLLGISSGAVAIGAANTSPIFSLPSTLNISTAVGTTGAAAAPPATPYVYVKVLVPDSSGALSTGYIPVYRST